MGKERTLNSFFSFPGGRRRNWNSATTTWTTTDFPLRFSLFSRDTTDLVYRNCGSVWPAESNDTQQRSLQRNLPENEPPRDFAPHMENTSDTYKNLLRETLFQLQDQKGPSNPLRIQNPYELPKVKLWSCSAQIVQLVVDDVHKSAILDLAMNHALATRAPSGPCHPRPRLFLSSSSRVV